jgi:hypothetical protein
MPRYTTKSAHVKAAANIFLFGDLITQAASIKDKTIKIHVTIESVRLHA